MALGHHHARPAARPTRRRHDGLQRRAGVRLRAARQGQSRERDVRCSNARAPMPGCAASAITGEVWEAINEGWMTLQRLLARPVRESNLGDGAGGDPARGDAGARRHARLDAAQRGLQLRPRRHVPRARRQHRAHPRREILPAAAVARLCRHRRSIPASGTHVLRSLSGERAYRWLNAGRMDARGDRRVPDPRRAVSRAAWRSAIDQLRENLAALARIHGDEGQPNVLMRDADQRLCRA